MTISNQAKPFPEWPQAFPESPGNAGTASPPRNPGTTVGLSRRHVLAAAAVTMAPTAARDASPFPEFHGKAKPIPESPGNPRKDCVHPGKDLRSSATPEHAGFGTGDPALAAIEGHRQAVQAWLAEDDEERRDQLLSAERDAWFVWLTTSPTTMAGVIATLEHAARRPYDNDYTHLVEAAHCDADAVAAAEQFPAMIAAALRKIAGG